MERVTLQAIRQQHQLLQLASGGEGVVYSMSGDPALVYKEYKVTVRPTLNATALQDLVDLPSSVPPEDWRHIASRSLWPQTLVTDGPVPVGFLMSRIDGRFYRRYGLGNNPKTVLCEWNYLVYQGSPVPPNMMSEIPRMDTRATLRLIRDLAATVSILHRNGVVIGDLSGRNLVWAPDEVVLLDCDSFRLDGRPGTTPSKQSPGWIDPTIGSGDTTQVSDVYKLGVAAYRALWHEPNRMPDPGELRATARTDIPDVVVDLIASSVQPSGRPTAKDWVESIERVNRYAGRPVIATRDPSGELARPNAASSTSVPLATQRPAAQRPSLPLH